MAGFTYLHSIVPNPDAEKLLIAAGAATFLVIAGIKAVKGLQSVIPQKKASLSGVFDLMMSGFVSYADSVMGKDNRKYIPLCATVFFFILTLNLLGVIPGVAAPTTSIWVNLGVALVVFCSFNAYGIKEHGIKGYLAHFCGPIPALAILLFPVEILSTILRILTLNLRLYWNVTADHLVLKTFVDLFGAIPLPVIFYFMGAFVSFMQAFVFTTLTMIYIVFATQHEESH